MTGKVFSTSTNVIQDEAQILFDYYRRAAEKIVAEETRVEQQIAQMEEDLKEHESQALSSKRNAIIFAAAAGTSLIGLIVTPIFIILTAVMGFFAFKNFNEMNNHNKAAGQCTQRCSELSNEWQAIRRDYGVERIGVAYVPVARRVAAGSQSFVVDYTGQQPETQFSLTLPKQPGALRDAMTELQQQLENIPTVETNSDCEEVDTSDYSTSVQDIVLHDYMGTIDRQVRTVNYLVEDSREVSVSIPVVPPSSERYRHLMEYSTTEVGDYPVVPVYDVKPIQGKVKAFKDMGRLSVQSAKDGSADVYFFASVMKQLAQGVDLVSRSKTASVTYLNNYVTHMLSNVLKASFDQYSPVLEAEEIERIRNTSFNFSEETGDWRPFSLRQSSRMRYDIYGETWVAEDGSRSTMPFGMHQVDAEVLMPVIGNLMRENRKERLRVYNNIQDQKIDYLAQWHRDTDDFFGRNRTEANELIQHMNEAYADYAENYTNYQQQSATLKAMRASGNLEDSEVEEANNQDEIIAGFVAQTSVARAKQDEFMAFMDRIRADIDESADRFGHINYYEAMLRDSGAHVAAEAAHNVANLDSRRAQLAPISPYLAQEGVLPPEPNVSEQLGEDFVIDLTGTADQEIASIAAKVQNARRSSGRR